MVTTNRRVLKRLPQGFALTFLFLQATCVKISAEFFWESSSGPSIPIVQNSFLLRDGANPERPNVYYPRTFLPPLLRGQGFLPSPSRPNYSPPDYLREEEQPAVLMRREAEAEARVQSHLLDQVYAPCLN